MNYEDDIPIPSSVRGNVGDKSFVLSSEETITIRKQERLMLSAPTPKISFKARASVYAVRGVLFVFSLGMVGTFAGGVNPSLAESVAQLVGQENIEKAAELKHRREEILWFARAIASESIFTPEQRYVAWAIKERVMAHNFPNTYKEVVLQPHQFSGLNHYDYWYDVNISRDYDMSDNVWKSALKVAEEVYDAPNEERLLPEGTTHFYSPVAVRQTPDWAVGKVPVETLPGRLGTRFAFFNNVN